jgi:hypothetical protein
LTSKDGADGGVKLRLGAKNSFAASSNTFETSIETENIKLNNKEFEVSLPIQSLLNIPSMEYRFAVKYNAERDMYRVTLENELISVVLGLNV